MARKAFRANLMQKLIKEQEELYRKERKLVDLEVKARQEEQKRASLLSEQYLAPDGGSSITDELRHSVNVDPLRDLNSYRSSIEYESRMVSLPMGFKEQVAAVKVQSVLRTFLVKKRLFKHANVMLRRYNNE